MRDRAAPATNAHPVDCHVGKRLSELRRTRGYTQSDLARALGLTFQQIQKYEKAANRISASKLWEISTFLNVDVTELFEGLRAISPEPVYDDGRISGSAKALATVLSRATPLISARRRRLIRALNQTWSREQG